MEKNELLLQAARGEATPRPPVWLMRQAGRILPEYRAVREKLSGFKELAETPALAAEVTLQPVELLGVDAAIIFSDILVVPEALGLPYEMAEARGPWFPQTISGAQDVARLRSPEAAADELGYVYDALDLTRKALAGRVPLIGFAGAPWTLLAYMVEGKGSKTFSAARRFLYTQPTAAHALLERLTHTTIAYLHRQVDHGAQLVQLFDSWAGILPQHQYRAFSLPYIQAICSALAPRVPVTIFAKDAWYALEDFSRTPCSVIGLDWQQDPQQARSRIPGKTLQGNLDPCVLYAPPETVSQATLAMLAAFGPRHIANLGHGVYPDTPLEGVKTFIETVKNFRYES